ncbi:MAG: VOC family protein [Pseudomonadales bacterium]
MITAMPRIAIATNDFSGIVSLFRDKLGMPVADVSEGSVASLGAKLAMCVPEGGSNIELMSPADPAAPLSMSLQKFLDRRGEGLFALMLEAPDPDAEAELLIERGLNVLPLMAGAGGRDIHPRSTHGVLIRVYPVDSFQAQPEQIQSDQTQALGLTGIDRIVIAVHDLEEAMGVYGRQLGMSIASAKINEQQGSTSSVCSPPSGGTIELVAVRDATIPFAKSIADHLSAHGEGMYALVLRALDSPDLVAALGERGIDAEPCDGLAGTLEIGRGSLFGARILIELSA